MTDHDNGPGPQPRIDELEAATLRLTGQIEGLNAALSQMHTISTRQAAMETRIVPREEIDAKAKKLAEDLIEAREKASTRLRQATAGIFLLILVLFIGSTVTFEIYKAGQRDFQQGLFDVCQRRNLQAQAVQTLLLNSKAQLEALPDGPRKRQELANFKLLKDGFPVVTCPKPQQ